MKPKAGPVVLPLEMPGAAEEAPLFVRVYRRLRAAIMNGGLVPGDRLPSARTLAADLAVSRTTIEAAYAELRAEGLLVRRVGSGSFVADALPERPRSLPRLRALSEPQPLQPVARSTGVSGRGRALVEAGASLPDPAPRVFSACSPALVEFPVRTWRRVADRCGRHMDAALLAPADPVGLRELREAIAAHLVTTRAVRCDWRQVIVGSSIQHALDLVVRLLLDPGDAAWLEEPGYLGARAALAAGGAHLVPVPVDEDGIDVAAGRALAPEARLAYVTPSHQFPLGPTLSLARRLALLRWAQEADAWIFEDDYDSEFRYGGRPVAALQGIEGGARVLYAGTFNKVLFPSLRLAYLVVPDDLVDAFAAARSATDGGPSAPLQAVLAAFIADGHFGTHVRRMRELYRERRDALVDAVASELGSTLRLGSAESGLHAVGYLPSGADDRAVAGRAWELGLQTPPLSRYHLGPSHAPGLLLGYGGETPERIRAGVRALARAL